jgi:hypothetical protein
VIAAVAVLLVVADTVRARRRASALEASGSAPVWPGVVARATSGAGVDGRDVATDVLGALVWGLPRVRAAIRAAGRGHGPTMSPAGRLAVVCARLADPRSDRLHAAAVVAGVSAPVVLPRLWRSEVDDIAHHDDRCAVARSARVGRWLLLAPLAPIALGLVAGPAAIVLAAVAVLAWFAAGTWIAAAGPRRIATCAPTEHLGAPSAARA